MQMLLGGYETRDTFKLPAWFSSHGLLRSNAGDEPCPKKADLIQNGLLVQCHSIFLNQRDNPSEDTLSLVSTIGLVE